jgi:hypothetical protein
VKWLLLVLVIALVAGPVAWLRPSAADKRHAALRMAARRAGLEVRVTALPQRRRARVRREPAEFGAAYALMVSRDHSAHWQPALWLRSADGGWESAEDASASLVPDWWPAIAAALPAEVQAVEVAPGRVAAYWREQGDAESVERLAAALQALKARLLTTVPVVAAD